MQTLIYKYTIDNHEELNKKILDHLSIYKTKIGTHSWITFGESHTHESSQALPDGWNDKNIWDTQKWSHIAYKKMFLDAAEDKLHEHARLHIRPDITELDYQFNISHMWYHQMEYPNCISWHNHYPGCHWSGLYFVKVPDQKYTEFLDPITQKVIRPDVKEGDMVLFPSWMLHKAPMIDSGIKTVIAWNMDIRI